MGFSLGVSHKTMLTPLYLEHAWVAVFSPPADLLSPAPLGEEGFSHRWVCFVFLFSKEVLALEKSFNPSPGLTFQDRWVCFVFFKRPPRDFSSVCSVLTHLQCSHPYLADAGQTGLRRSLGLFCKKFESHLLPGETLDRSPSTSLLLKLYPACPSFNPRPQSTGLVSGRFPSGQGLNQHQAHIIIQRMPLGKVRQDFNHLV